MAPTDDYKRGHSIDCAKMTIKAFLYLLVFSNGKEYIGLTTGSPKLRLLGHIRDSRKRRVPVHHAFQKYGTPTLYTLAEGSLEYIQNLEIAAIDKFQTLAPKGYNLAAGGQISPMKNPEVAAKVSAKLAGIPKPWMLGENNPAKHPSFAGKVSGDKNPAKLPENRAKISAALRLDRSRPFKCIETGIVYPTLQEAVNWLHSIGKTKVIRTGVRKVLVKGSSHIHGYHFEYL